MSKAAGPSEAEKVVERYARREAGRRYSILRPADRQMWPARPKPYSLFNAMPPLRTHILGGMAMSDLEGAKQ